MNEKLKNTILSRLSNDYSLQTYVCPFLNKPSLTNMWVVNTKTNSTDVSLFFGTVNYGPDINLFLDLFSLNKLQKEQIIHSFFYSLLENNNFEIDDEFTSFKYCKKGVPTLDEHMERVNVMKMAMSIF
jgi:hypothetical protein